MCKARSAPQEVLNIALPHDRARIHFIGHGTVPCDKVLLRLVPQLASTQINDPIGDAKQMTLTVEVT